MKDPGNEVVYSRYIFTTSRSRSFESSHSLSPTGSLYSQLIPATQKLNQLSKCTVRISG